MASQTDRRWTTTHGSLLLAVSFEPREIGQRIARAREAKRWTQLTFALEANVSPSSVQRWESGKLPPIRELIRIADLLGIPPEELVEAAPVDEDRLARLEAQLETVLGLVREVRDELLALRGDERAPQQASAQER